MSGKCRKGGVEKVAIMTFQDSATEIGLKKITGRGNQINCCLKEVALVRCSFGGGVWILISALPFLLREHIRGRAGI